MDLKYLTPEIHQCSPQNQFCDFLLTPAGEMVDPTNCFLKKVQIAQGQIILLIDSDLQNTPSGRPALRAAVRVDGGLAAPRTYLL